MRRFRNLEKSLERITVGADAWIPLWLSAVGSWEEIAEWKAILQTPRGREDRAERRLEFQRKMREVHPDMPLTIEEEMERGVQRLNANPWLRWREGLHDDPVVDRIMTQLTHEEWYHLAKAILTFEEANAAPDAVLTSASETLAGLPAEQGAVIMKVRRLYEEQRH